MAKQIFTAYTATKHDMTHYYFQRQDCVVHINKESVLINQLDVDFLSTNNDGYPLRKITVEEFLAVASSIFTDLGFSISHHYPLTINGFVS